MPGRSGCKKQDPVCSGREKKIVDDEKERMWEAQQELLKARREGENLLQLLQHMEQASCCIVVMSCSQSK